MFALNGPEIAVLTLATCAVVLSIAAIRRGGDLRLGIGAILAAVFLPVLGPVLALVYVGLSSSRARRADPHGQRPR